MGKRDGVKKARKPKWRVQGRICLRCSKLFWPENRKQEMCGNCNVLIMLGMSEIGCERLDSR